VQILLLSEAYSRRTINLRSVRDEECKKASVIKSFIKCRVNLLLLLDKTENFKFYFFERVLQEKENIFHMVINDFPALNHGKLLK